MVIFKTFLCGAFIVGGAWVGMIYAGRLTHRKRVLSEVVRGLQIFENEIYYTRERLEGAALYVSRAGEGTAACLFRCFADSLHERSGQSACYLWKETVRKCFRENDPLTAKDIDAISRLGHCLGSTDVKGQIENVEHTLKELSVRLSDAGNMESQKGRVYRTAGLAGGILCAVLIV